MDTNSDSAQNNGNGKSAVRIPVAVRVQHASKTYGAGPEVLKNLSMTIEKGTMSVFIAETSSSIH